MSEQCESKFNAQGSMVQCSLRKGHVTCHEFDFLQWWDETIAPIIAQPPISGVDLGIKSQEMTSLVQIKAKLDAIAKRQDEDRTAISSWISAVENGQIRLMAALNEIGARTGDTLAMVNTIDFAVRKELLAALNHIEGEFSGDFAKLYNGHSLALEKLSALIDAWNLAFGKRRPAKPKRKRKK